MPAHQRSVGSKMLTHLGTTCAARVRAAVSLSYALSGGNSWLFMHSAQNMKLAGKIFLKGVNENVLGVNCLREGVRQGGSLKDFSRGPLWQNALSWFPP